MIRSILVPVDGSPSAEQALALAARLAARDGARLDLVLVTERVSPLEMALGAPVPEPRLDYALRQERVVYLTDLAKRIERDQSVRATANVSEGPVADTLARLVAEGDTDLVMMTTHGRGGMSPTWLASTADALVSRVDIPVLVVRPSEGREPQAVAAAFPPRRVLVPLDGSELAESVLDAAVAVGGSSATYILARASDAEPVHGLTVEIVGLERDAAADLRTRVHDYLNAVAAGFRARGLQVETTSTPRPRPGGRDPRYRERIPRRPDRDSHAGRRHHGTSRRGHCRGANRARHDRPGSAPSPGPGAEGGHAMTTHRLRSCLAHSRRR